MRRTLERGTEIFDAETKAQTGALRQAETARIDTCGREKPHSGAINAKRPVKSQPEDWVVGAPGLEPGTR
jgi:hypothetical protein